MKGRCLIAAWVIAAAALGGCSEATPPEPETPAVEDTTPRPLTVSSDTLRVSGEYTPLALDEVSSVAVEDGKLVIHGSTTTASVEPPAAADVAKPTRRWALITEAHVDDKRLLVFTHEESLDDFTIELPDTDAPIKFGVFEGKNGGEVLVLAWGEGSRSYWGYVTIARRG